MVLKVLEVQIIAMVLNWN